VVESLLLQPVNTMPSATSDPDSNTERRTFTCGGLEIEIVENGTGILVICTTFGKCQGGVYAAGINGVPGPILRELRN